MALTAGTLSRDENRVPIQNYMAQILGIPYVGKVFWVDPTNGNDTTNSGLRPGDAYKTLANAEDDMTEYNHDVVVILPGGTSGTAETATITWDKDYCHVLGSTAPTHVSQRSRVLTTTDSVDPCLTISANGCIFQNIQIATYQANNDVLVNLTGDRNYFKNVHFAGIGHATAGDDTSARCITLTGAEENLFKDCTIGLDTVARSVANASVEFASGSTRNKFVDCDFLAYADNAGVLFVKAASAATIDRYVIFENCLFHNAANSGATAMTVAMDLHAAAGGTIILRNCWKHGASDWADDFTTVYIDMAKPDTDEGGFLTVAT